MRGRAGVAVIAVVSLGLPAAARAADPTELTPDGPATLINEYTGAVTLEGRSPSVLVGVRVQVGAGGRAGTVRVRATRNGTTLAGDPVTLPAEPGTYTFPAPHLAWDSRDGQLGIDQTTGGHAIVSRTACRPEAGQLSDPCQILAVNVFAGDPPPATATSHDAGAQLALTGVEEPDSDRDLRGDRTEDRTDLKLRSATTRDAAGRVLTTVTVTNAGPLSADLPSLTAALTPGLSGRWDSGCLPSHLVPDAQHPDCPLAPLAAGASRTLTLISTGQAAGTIGLSVASEGPDLAPADNSAAAAVTRPAAFALDAARKQRLAKGIRLGLLSPRAGSARVSLAFAVHGRTVRLARTLTLAAATRRTLTIHPQGATLRSLRRAVRAHALRGTVTVTRSGETETASEPITLS